MSIKLPMKVGMSIPLSRADKSKPAQSAPYLVTWVRLRLSFASTGISGITLILPILPVPMKCRLDNCGIQPSYTSPYRGVGSRQQLGTVWCRILNEICYSSLVMLLLNGVVHTI